MGANRLGLVLVAAVLLSACGEEKPQKKAVPAKPKAPAIELVATPAFDAQLAYDYVQKQVDFGPRIPNTEAHKACAQWLQAEFESFGLEVQTQETTVTAFNDARLEIFNIMAQYNPQAEKRVLLCAHWDTRPFADRADKNKTKPFDGANDGGSGTAVLLALAKAIAADSNQLDLGIDFVLFDAEDYGQPSSSMTFNPSQNTWCLGSTYWAQNPPVEGYTAEYGILLDMVGASTAVFPKEGASMRYAPQVVNKVWSIARVMNYNNYFIQGVGPEITDDHIPLNRILKIPTIDILHYELGRMDFGSFHHTHDDNMDIIDQASLRAVGEVVMQVLYQS